MENHEENNGLLDELSWNAGLLLEDDALKLVNSILDNIVGNTGTRGVVLRKLNIVKKQSIIDTLHFRIGKAKPKTLASMERWIASAFRCCGGVDNGEIRALIEKLEYDGYIEFVSDAEMDADRYEHSDKLYYVVREVRYI